MQKDDYQTNQRPRRLLPLRELVRGFDEWVKGLRSMEGTPGHPQGREWRMELIPQGSRFQSKSDDGDPWQDDGGESD